MMVSVVAIIATPAGRLTDFDPVRCPVTGADKTARINHALQ